MTLISLTLTSHQLCPHLPACRAPCIQVVTCPASPRTIHNWFSRTVDGPGRTLPPFDGHGRDTTCLLLLSSALFVVFFPSVRAEKYQQDLLVPSIWFLYLSQLVSAIASLSSRNRSKSLVISISIYLCI